MPSPTIRKSHATTSITPITIPAVAMPEPSLFPLALIFPLAQPPNMIPKVPRIIPKRSNPTKLQTSDATAKPFPGDPATAGKVLCAAASVGQYSPQCLHFCAIALIVSPQNGHVLVSIDGTGCTVIAIGSSLFCSNVSLQKGQYVASSSTVSPQKPHGLVALTVARCSGSSGLVSPVIASEMVNAFWHAGQVPCCPSNTSGTFSLFWQSGQIVTISQISRL